MSNITVWADGFSSPKKKNMAGFCIIVEQDGKEICSSIVHMHPDMTNNAAELEAILGGLRWVQENISPVK